MRRTKLIGRQWAALLALIGLCVFAKMASADLVPSPWLATPNPTLVKEFDLAPGETMPITVAGLGNRDCKDTTVVTRPVWIFQSQQTVTSCFVSTLFGLADSNGVLQYKGSRVAGRTVNFGGYQQGLIAIPNSADIINYTSAGSNGLFLHFSRALPAPTTVDVSLFTAEVMYRFSSAASASLRDKSGTLLAAQSDSLSFSNNGLWMVVDSPGKAMLRVNVATLEVTPFAPAFNYSLGIDPGAQTAVSNDGRYAMVVSKEFGVFKIYDLSTCGVVPNAITGPVNCQSRDLMPFVSSQFVGLLAASVLRFDSNNVISFYPSWNPGSGNKRSKYSLLAPGTTKTPLTYLGMGDSFASGEGDNLGGTFYEAGTDEELNLCHLSRRSYPYLLKTALSINDFHSVACSGALRSHITSITSQGVQYPIKPVNNTLGDWLPGYQRQLDYLALTTAPSFITVSIGGNDIGFADAIAECATSHFKIPLPTTCAVAGNPNRRSDVAKNIADQYGPLKELYAEIIRSTNKKTRVYVVGYPVFVKGVGGSCGLNVPLNDQERLFISNSAKYLNQVVKAAADAAGAYYLDIENVLEGRNLCSIVEDRLMAVNGVTEGNDKHLPWWGGYLVGGVSGIVTLQRLGLGNESFHPNSSGHQLMYQRILGLTGGDPNNFVVCPSTAPSLICPKGDGKVPLPDQTYFGSDAVNYANNFNVASPVAVTLPSQPANIVVDSATPTNNQVQLSRSYLLPGAIVDIKDQTGALIGHYIASSQGMFNATVTMPPTISPGAQSIHIVTTNMGGETVDYYQSVFIPGPLGDLNANGILDSQETCGFVAPSGKDIDVDGIDDACDGEIGQLPVFVQPLYRQRPGNVGKGENPALTYLERNVGVAKQALGIHDYDPDGDGWATVGHTPQNPTTLTGINTLLIDLSSGATISQTGQIDPSYISPKTLSYRQQITPIVIAWDQNTSSCIAYKPTIVAVVTANGPDQTLTPAQTPTGSTCSPPYIPRVTLNIKNLRVL